MSSHKQQVIGSVRPMLFLCSRPQVLLSIHRCMWALNEKMTELPHYKGSYM